MSAGVDLGVLVHELRAPVAALASLAEAARAADEPERRHRLVALAVGAGRDVERILADPELRAYDHDDLDVAALVEGVTAGAPVVEARVEPGLRLRGDATRLRQALANLVANALRHGTSVQLTAERAGEWVVVEVADDGPGVATGVDPFARGTSGAGSTGYGLWIARTIAEAHGGTLTLMPAPTGARFRLCLPSSAAAG